MCLKVLINMLVAVRDSIANHKFGCDLSGGPNVLAPDGVDHRLGCHRDRTEFASSSCSDHCQVQAYPALQEGVSPEVSLSWFCSWLQLERKGHWITQLLDVCDSTPRCLWFKRFHPHWCDCKGYRCQKCKGRMDPNKSRYMGWQGINAPSIPQGQSVCG